MGKKAKKGDSRSVKEVATGSGTRPAVRSTEKEAEGSLETDGEPRYRQPVWTCTLCRTNAPTFVHGQGAVRNQHLLAAHKKELWWGCAGCDRRWVRCRHFDCRQHMLTCLGHDDGEAMVLVRPVGSTKEDGEEKAPLPEPSIPVSQRLLSLAEGSKPAPRRSESSSPGWSSRERRDRRRSRSQHRKRAAVEAAEVERQAPKRKLQRRGPASAAVGVPPAVTVSRASPVRAPSIVLEEEEEDFCASPLPLAVDLDQSPVTSPAIRYSPLEGSDGTSSSSSGEEMSRGLKSVVTVPQELSALVESTPLEESPAPPGEEHWLPVPHPASEPELPLVIPWERLAGVPETRDPRPFPLGPTSPVRLLECRWDLNPGDAPSRVVVPLPSPAASSPLSVAIPDQDGLTPLVEPVVLLPQHQGPRLTPRPGRIHWGRVSEIAEWTSAQRQEVRSWLDYYDGVPLREDVGTQAGPSAPPSPPPPPPPPEDPVYRFSYLPPTATFEGGYSMVGPGITTLIHRVHWMAPPEVPAVVVTEEGEEVAVDVHVATPEGFHQE